MAAPPAAQKIDRQSTTPFLLKLFYRTGSFHRIEDFTPHSSPSSHLQIYTWPTCSLRELTQLLVTALPSLLPSPAIGTRIAFRLIFPDARPASANGPPRYISKELGSVVVSAEPDVTTPAPPIDGLDGEAQKTLQEARFVIGDYVSCAVLPPLANGEVAGPSPPQPPGYGGMRAYGGRGSGPPPRENGFGSSRGGFSDRGGRVPDGDWRRGDVPPPTTSGYSNRDAGFGSRDAGARRGSRDFGGSGYGGGYGRGRGRGRGRDGY